MDKPLFLLGRARRSVSTLDTELDEFEQALGLSADASVAGGDLVLWLFRVATEVRRSKHTHYPDKFWDAHGATIASGLLSDYVIGEIGRDILSASQTKHVDKYKLVDKHKREEERTYMYGTQDNDEQPGSPRVAAHNDSDETDEDEEDDDWRWYDEDEPDDPYAEREFWTVGAMDWFQQIGATDDTPSFGRKLLILFGRDPKTRFLESRLGQKLRAQLGDKARVVLNAQGSDVAAIAFEDDASCTNVFERIKRCIPPRLIEDFLIMEIGVKYCVGDQPISIFDQWSQQERSYFPDLDEFEPESEPDHQPPAESQGRKMILVEVKRRKPPTAPRNDGPVNDP